MSDSKFVDGFTYVELELPHRATPVRCAPPTLKESAALLRLFDQTRVSDTATADLMEQFPAKLRLPEDTFDGLSVAEFLAVVGRFFSVRRDLETTPGTAAVLGNSSTGPG